MGKIPPTPLYKGGFLNPLHLSFIPELCTSFLAITIHILPEECHLLGSSHYNISYLSYDILLWSRYLASTGMRYDAKSTEVITSSLDDDIGTRRIFLELLDLEVFVELGVITDIFTSYHRQDLREI